MKHIFSEAIKLKDGKLYNLSYHQERLNRTQHKFGGPQIILSDVLHNIPVYVQTGLFKCRIEYGQGVEKIEFIPYTFRKIKKVGVAVDDNIDYSFKYTRRQKLNDLLKKSGCDDIIIIRQGLVTDAYASNLVFQSGNGLFTPDSYLLQGTKRQYLIDNKTIIEKHITLDDIGSYNRIYFINAMVDIEDNIYAETSDIVGLH